MPIKIYKPITPGRRGMSIIVNKELGKNKPLKGLTRIKKNKGGRGNSGRITVRHQGGGARRRIRLIDFKGDKFDIPATVVSLEYDPNRNANIALLNYVDGEKRYMIAPLGLAKGDQVISSIKNFKLGAGNRFTLEMIPPGTVVNNVEIEPGKGGKLARAAGNGIVIQVVAGQYAQLKMPSGEIRKVSENAWASIGAVSNEEYKHRNLGKAGRSRWLGIRPTVRGSAMNPVDHPYGGGEGRQGRGTKRPKTKWGKVTGGRKTRSPKKYSNNLIVARRKTKKSK